MGPWHSLFSIGREAVQIEKQTYDSNLKPALLSSLVKHRQRRGDYPGRWFLDADFGLCLFHNFKFGIFPALSGHDVVCMRLTD